MILHFDTHVHTYKSIIKTNACKYVYVYVISFKKRPCAFRILIYFVNAVYYNRMPVNQIFK